MSKDQRHDAPDDAGWQAEFDIFADEYSAMHAANISASGEGPEYFAEYKIREVARDMAGRPAGRILDFGTGVGASLPYLRKYFPDAEITGLDVSEKSLAIAARNADERMTLRHYDGTSIPFADGSFDLVFTACVFHHIPAEMHVTLLREIGRVLRPEGFFYIFEHNPLNPLTVQAVNTCPFDENAVLIRSSLAKSRIRQAGMGRVQRAYCVFFPKFAAALRPLERWLTWLPLGAQYYVKAQPARR